METEAQNKPDKKERGFWGELLSYVLTALIIVVPIRMFIAQPFVVNGASMDTTFLNGEYLIIDEISYRFGEPARGDVIVFRYPLDPKKYFIKRVIGLPKETVSITNQTITIKNEVHPQGFTLDESYTHSETVGTLDTTLGDSEYFVMGDNRILSSDSRSWGPLPEENIVGRPIMRLYPFSRIEFQPGAEEFLEENLNK